MVGIQGLGGIPEPKSDRPAATRNDRDRNTNSVGGARTGSGAQDSQDNVIISSEAQAAAELSQVLQASQNQGEIRTERVEAARERIDQGNFRDPEVVNQVAERLLKYLG